MTLLKDDFAGNDRYKRGDNWVTDDRTEARIRFSDSRMEWTGAIVASADWEARNVQDFVQGVPDDQSVPDPRPVPTPTFTGPLTAQTVGNATTGSLSVVVDSSARFMIGDRIGLYLDTLDLFLATVTDVPDQTHLVFAPRLPGVVPDGMAVINYTVSAPGSLDP